MFVSQYDRTSPIAQPLAQSALPPAMDLLSGMRGTRADSVMRMLPPWLNAGAQYQGSPLAPLSADDGTFSAIAGLLQQILGMLSMVLGGGFGTMLGGLFGGNERFFQNASGASVGDPHLTFNGQHWDSMTSHSDLLHSDSVPGGYQLSTEVTQPGANGVTLNREATISTNYGNTSISLDNGGNATLVDGDRRIALQPGTSIDLGNGETVNRAQDGSLSVTIANETGGKITTTLRAQNGGVDVSVDAHNVDLGGDLTAREGAVPTLYQPLATPRHTQPHVFGPAE